MSIVNESSNFLKICSLLNAKKEFIVKFPSQALFINHVTAISVTCSLLIIATVILNGVSVVTIFKCSQLKEKISYFLIMMQSVADLTVGLISLPSLAIYCSFMIATTRSLDCTEILLMERLFALPPLISVTTLLAMTVERYFGVLHPLKHRTLITKKRIVVFHACGTSFMLTIVALCTVRIDLLGTFLSMFLFIFLFVAVFVYTKIFLTIRKRRCPGNADDLNNSAERSVSYRQCKRDFLKQIRLAKSCFLAVTCFAFCFLVGILAALPHGLDKFEVEIINIWALTLLMLNSSVNSIIFFWTRPLLRNEAGKALKSLCE
jgi:hypothetical protein